MPLPNSPPTPCSTRTEVIDANGPSARITLSSPRNAVSFFIGAHNEPPSVVAMRISNPDGSPLEFHDEPRQLFFDFDPYLTGDGVGVSATCIANFAAARSSAVDMRTTCLSSPSRNRAVATSTSTYLLSSADGV